MCYKYEISLLIDATGIITSSDTIELLVPPKDSAYGDYALPCFKFASALKKSPQAISEMLAAAINANNPPTFISEVSAISGYLNFRLNNVALAERILSNIILLEADYGTSITGAGKTVCIDYSSINIAKPFHIGHLSATALGAALYRIYRKLSYNVIGINHLGDWGTQFGKLIVAYKKWGDPLDVEKRGVKSFFDIYTKFHAEAENDKTLDAEARVWFKKIEDGDKEALALFNFFKEVTLAEVSKIYDRLHVKFDSYAGESFYNDKLQSVIDELNAKGLLKESEGAKVVGFSDDEMPPCLILRSDGASLYATRDLAAIFYRKNRYAFDKCLYVVAYQQNLHFKQVFKVVELMGYDWADTLVHVAFGMVSLEGEAMSTRRGNVAFLDDVLNRAKEKALAIIENKSPNLADKDATAEKIGVGAVIFGVIHGNRIKDIDFRWDIALSFEGETAPYVQYTVARAGSVLEKAAKLDCSPDYSALDNPEAAETVRLLSRYPEIIETAAERYEPSLLARYAVDLAEAYNKFYFEHSILKAEPPAAAARLRLTECTKIILTDAFDLLGIECPEKM